MSPTLPGLLPASRKLYQSCDKYINTRKKCCVQVGGLHCVRVLTGCIGPAGFHKVQLRFWQICARYSNFETGSYHFGLFSGMVTISSKFARLLAVAEASLVGNTR